MLRRRRRRRRKRKRSRIEGEKIRREEMSRTHHDVLRGREACLTSLRSSIAVSDLPQNKFCDAQRKSVVV